MVLVMKFKVGDRVVFLKPWNNIKAGSIRTVKYHTGAKALYVGQKSDLDPDGMIVDKYTKNLELLEDDGPKNLPDWW